MNRLTILTICRNEAQMMPFFLRHYSQFADRIVIWDEQSNDGTREIAAKFPKVEIREWPHKGLDDEKFLAHINSCYREFADSKWVMFPDVDELLYHPEMEKALDTFQGDLIGSKGYALISKSDFPNGEGQAYEQVKTGYPQSNYDKAICWRPQANITHTIGRHCYPGRFPQVDGVPVTPEPVFKLFHLHHLGGVDHTRMINMRNLHRATDKRFAWNYTAAHDHPEQVGTVAWVQSLIDRDLLYDVVSDAPVNSGRKLNFGCGGMLKPGWENFDMDVDIRKRLPFPDGCAAFIHAEHVIEHVTPQQAWSFLEECKRVLKIGGTVRAAFPDLCRMRIRMTPDYAQAVKLGGHGDNPLRAAVFEHGHQGAWNAALMKTVMESIGFIRAEEMQPGFSRIPELREVEQHWKSVGKGIEFVETSCVEATKI